MARYLETTREAKTAHLSPKRQVAGCAARAAHPCLLALSLNSREISMKTSKPVEPGNASGRWRDPARFLRNTWPAFLVRLLFERAGRRPANAGNLARLSASVGV